MILYIFWERYYYILLYFGKSIYFLWGDDDDIFKRYDIIIYIHIIIIYYAMMTYVHTRRRQDMLWYVSLPYFSLRWWRRHIIMMTLPFFSPAIWWDIWWKMIWYIIYIFCFSALSPYMILCHATYIHILYLRRYDIFRRRRPCFLLFSISAAYTYTYYAIFSPYIFRYYAWYAIFSYMPLLRYTPGARRYFLFSIFSRQRYDDIIDDKMIL